MKSAKGLIKIATISALIFLLWGSRAYALDDSCNESSEKFYQCIQKFITKTLPDTDWCTLIPVEKKDKAKSGFILLNLNLNSKNSQFSHTSYFFKKDKSSEKLGTSTGEWSLENNVLNMDYDDKVFGVSDVISLPKKIFVDFEDENGEKLILNYPSENPNEMFGPVTFTRCNDL